MSISLSSIGAKCVSINQALTDHTTGRHVNLAQVQSELEELKADIRFYEHISPSSPLEAGTHLFSGMTYVFERTIAGLAARGISPNRWDRLVSQLGGNPSLIPALQQMHAALSRDFDSDIVDHCFWYSEFLSHMSSDDSRLISSSCSSSSSSSSRLDDSRLIYSSCSSSSPSPLNLNLVYEEFSLRIRHVSYLLSQFNHLLEQRPAIPRSEEMHNSFQRMLFSIYLYRGLYSKLPLDHVDYTRMTDCYAFLSELTAPTPEGDVLTDEDVSYLLKVGMAQYSHTVPSEHIKHAADLFGLQRLTKFLMRAQTLPEVESYSEYHAEKKMCLIRNPTKMDEIVGKFKFFAPTFAESGNPHQNEALGYAYDQLLFAEMTCPTKLASISFEKELSQIVCFLRTYRESEALERFMQLPAVVRSVVYRCIKPLPIEKPSDPLDISRVNQRLECENGLKPTSEELAQAVEVYIAALSEGELRQIIRLFENGNERQAFIRFLALPTLTKNSIFGWVFTLKQPRNPTLTYGEDCFFGRYGFESNTEDRVQAIQVYLSSPAFRKLKSLVTFRPTPSMNDGQNLGVLQLWRSSENAENFLNDRPDAGKLMREISVAKCHRYALLGWLKGPKDGNLSNTLLQLKTESTSLVGSSTGGGSSEARVETFLDCDDELLSAKNKAYPQSAMDNLRVWQFGLPQNARPFFRAELLLLASSSIGQKMSQWTRKMYWIHPEGLDAQRMRVSELEPRALMALRSGNSFSPRDLYREVISDATAVESSFKDVPPVLAYDPPRKILWHGDTRTPVFVSNMGQLYQTEESASSSSSSVVEPSSPEQTQTIDPNQDSPSFVENNSDPQGNDSE